MWTAPAGRHRGHAPCQSGPQDNEVRWLAALQRACPPLPYRRRPAAAALPPVHPLPPHPLACCTSLTPTPED